MTRILPIAAVAALFLVTPVGAQSVLTGEGMKIVAEGTDRDNLPRGSTQRLMSTDGSVLGRVTAQETLEDGRTRLTVTPDSTLGIDEATLTVTAGQVNPRGDDLGVGLSRQGFIDSYRGE